MLRRRPLHPAPFYKRPSITSAYVVHHSPSLSVTSVAVSKLVMQVPLESAGSLIAPLRLTRSVPWVAILAVWLLAVSACRCWRRVSPQRLQAAQTRILRDTVQAGCVCVVHFASLRPHLCCLVRADTVVHCNADLCNASMLVLAQWNCCTLSSCRAGQGQG